MSAPRSARATRRSRGGDGAPRRASALVLCLVVLVALIMAGYVSVYLAHYRRTSAKVGQEADRAFVVAESGADYALYELQTGTDRGGDGLGNTSGDIGEGSFTTVIDPAFAGPGEYTIRSTATVDGFSRGVEMVVGARTQGPGVIGLNSVSLSGGGVFDSYDSSKGSYASQLGGKPYAQSDGDIQSNGNISLSGAAAVYGDATPGPGKAVTGKVANVHGSTAPASKPIVANPYVYAPTVPSSGAFSGSKSFTSGTYRYSTFTVPGGKSVTFNGTVELWVDGKFTISGSGYGLLNPGATLVIHHGSSDFVCSGSGIINKDLLPKNLTVYSASLTKTDISGPPRFYCTIYAPQASLICSGGSGLFGAATSKSILISGGAGIHYDSSLGAGNAGFAVRMQRERSP